MEDGRRPGDIPHPVRVALERLLLLLVRLRRRVKDPNLEQVVTTTRDKPPDARGARAWGTANDAARCRCWGPGHGVDAQAVGREGDVVEAVVTELENTDVAVGGSTGEEASRLVW